MAQCILCTRVGLWAILPFELLATMLVPFAAPRPWQFRSVRSAGRVLQLRRFSEVIEHTAYLNMILNAKVYDVCKRTDLHFAPGLSKSTGSRVFLKREDQQSVFSFKLRGAYNKIVNLILAQQNDHVRSDPDPQGVAYSAAALDISAKIFMPQTTPNIKVDSVRRQRRTDGRVRLGRVLVHPFNDPLVIAGQGTIGKEILEQTTKEDVEAVFCCVGGGGLLAGVGAFLKAVKPSIKVIGVGQFADGAAVAKVGDETFRLCTAFADEMITVSTDTRRESLCPPPRAAEIGQHVRTRGGWWFRSKGARARARFGAYGWRMVLGELHQDEICAAIKDSFKDTRVVLEPAGALATAGLKRYAMERQDLVQGRTLVAVSSGANMDFDRLRFVSERADTSETHIAVYIPERPGAFIDFYRFIFPRNEFTYRISGNPASIFMSFQAKSDDDRAKALNTTAGYDVMDLSENELAKTHGRSLIGGRAPTELTAEEGSGDFEFPEKPGALMKFLEQLPSDFNVSLFHYRGHGADVARVLVGLQVPSKSRPRFREYLAYLVSKGYSWKETCKWVER
eukprot:g31782.t1